MDNPIPANENERLKALQSYQILDTIPEEQFDRLTKLASLICEAPITLISLIDENRQWFKSNIGLEDVSETPRDISFCQHAIMKDELFEIEDATKDDRFKDNVLVTGNPDIRFYAGQPIIDANGYALGTLCVIDRKAHKLNDNQKTLMAVLAKEIAFIFESQQKNKEREKFEAIFNMSPDLICIAGKDGFFKKINPAIVSTLGYEQKELLEKPFFEYIHPDDIALTVKEIEKLSTGQKSTSFRIRFLKKDGNYILINWAVTPEPSTGEMYAIGRDITIEKIKEDELFKSNQFQNAILNGTDYAIITTSDPDGIITSFNKGAEKMLGYSAEEVIGIKSPSIFHINEEVEAKAIVLSEELNLKIKPGIDVFHIKSRLGSSSDINEWTYIRKDGSRLTIELSISTLKDNENNIISYLGIAKDITEEKINEEKLLKSIQFQNAILNGTDYAIISTDKDGLITQFNSGAVNMLGYAKEEIVNKTSPAIFHDVNEIVTRAAILSKELNTTIETGFNVFTAKTKLGLSDVNEWTYIRKDGTKLIVELSVTGLQNELHEYIGFVGVAKDITEKMKKDEQLKMLSIVAEKTDNAVIITNKNQEIEWVNAGYEKITGYTLQECIGCKPGQMLQGADTNPETVKAIKLALDKKEPFNGVILNYHKSGFPYWLQLFITPILDENGEVERFIAIESNISERIEKENELKQINQQLAQFKNALDSSSIVAITDQKGKIIMVNDNFCKISKYSKEELIGQDHRIINSGYHTKEFIRNIWLTIANGDVWKGEIKNKAKDGTFYWVDTTIVPFLDEKGKPFQYMAIRSEITNRKLGEERLNEYLDQIESKNKELDQFSYIVSHDLKAPLRAINNLAEWIVEDLGEVPEDVSKNIATLRGRVHRMEDMINGILEYSKIGRKKLPIEKIDINLLVNQVIESIAIPSSFKINVQKDLPIINAENILIYQIFANLISNAIKYNDKENGIIDIGFADDKANYIFSVKDNGPGILPEYFDKVFAMFQTIEARDTKESTGIGLSLVKKIIDEKDGKIWIESDGKTGCDFKFSLPK